MFRSGEIILAFVAFTLSQQLLTIEANPIQQNQNTIRLRAKRSLWSAPQSYIEQSPIERELKYCKFILKYAEEFDKIYVVECEKWMASYLVYMDYLEKQRQMEEQHRLEREKKQQEEEDRLEAEAEKRLKMPLRGEAKDHILRNS